MITKTLYTVLNNLSFDNHLSNTQPTPFCTARPWISALCVVPICHCTYPLRMARLGSPGWLVTCWDAILISRQLPTKVLNGQLQWLRLIC